MVSEMKKARKYFALLITSAALVTGVAQASVVVGGTRVVYPMDQREVSVKLTNDSANASLVQVWIDDGDANEKPADSKAPFVITPPIFRMDAGKSQTLRVIYGGAALPQDRESVYWLNVLDIPPKAEEQPGANTLRFAYRTRLKVFVRPKKLPGNPDEAPRQLDWKVVPANQGSGQSLAVTNPTAYHVSFSEISVLADGHIYRNDKGGMATPKGQSLIDIPKMSGVHGGKVHYIAINDFGGAIEGDATLAP
ncbi:fimbria/pilus periplasmic chaperone [Burkholderia sp. Ax-1719]|nr:fimbria/pilus periplasmic chaperone [Burkholderia sp. Ax-1719]NIE64484.1 fimbria/pilus periplasmic chaperone [Burkholderia sp. Ax-1719]